MLWLGIANSIRPCPYQQFAFEAWHICSQPHSMNGESVLLPSSTLHSHLPKTLVDPLNLATDQDALKSSCNI